MKVFKQIVIELPVEAGCLGCPLMVERGGEVKPAWYVCGVVNGGIPPDVMDEETIPSLCPLRWADVVVRRKRQETADDVE